MEEKKKKSGLILVIAVVLILASIASAFYFYTKYNELKSNPDMIATQELASIVEKVGKLIELPTDETPSLATVEDIDSLKNEAFFSTAQNGDKLLLYTNEQLAILYRPSTDKIVKVAPLYLESETAETQEVEITDEEDIDIEDEN